MRFDRVLVLGIVLSMVLMTFGTMNALAGQVEDEMTQEFVGPPPLEMPDEEGRAIIRNWKIQVAFEFGPTKSKLNDVIEGLKRGNQVLFDATEGQFRWKSAEVWTHGMNYNAPETDIQILDEGPQYRANAVRGGIDINGATVRLGKTLYGQPWDSDLGGIAMAHEWSHYGLYLPDEYTDEVVGGWLVSVPWCNECLMSNMSDIDLDTEYCTLDNHNYSNPNAEAAGSCWEQIRNHYPGTTIPNTAASIQQDGPYYAPEDEMTFIIHFPDLYIEPPDISMTPAAPYEGQTVTLSAKVHNKDAMLVGDVVDVRFYDGPIINNDLIGTKSFSLSGSAIDTVEIDWVAEGGVHDIHVQIDPNNQVVEWEDYSNNTANRSFVIPAKPVIGANLGDQSADEDVPVVLSLKQYESDIESPDEELLWTVDYYDVLAIANIEGEESVEDIITLTPKKNFFGSTDVTLLLTDGDGLTDGRTIKVTWNPVNDAPEIGTILLGRDWVYRTESVLISFDGSDPEDQSSSLTPDIGVKYTNGSSWTALSPNFDNNFFKVLFSPGEDMELGPYDVRARLTDTALKAGEYEFLNASLEVLNGPATISDYELASEVAFRGQPLDIALEGGDLEDDDDELLIEVQYQPYNDDVWHYGATFDDKTGNYDRDDEDWVIPFIFPPNTTKGKCDLRMRFIDLDGPGPWLHINDTVTVKNSLPTVTAFTAEEDSVLRTEGLNITLKGGDLETEPDLLMVLLEQKVGRTGKWKTGDISDSEIIYDEDMDEWQISFTPPKDAELGDYYLKVELKDGDGEMSETFEMTDPVTVQNNLPTVMMDGKATAEAGQVIVFDGKGSADIEDTTGLRYEWDFKDGSKSSKQRVSHAFSKAGVYKVTLTVTDKDGGSTMKEMTVRVTGGSISTNLGASMAMIAGIAVAVILVVVILVVIIMKKKGIGPF